MHKTLKDVLRVIEDKRPEAAIDIFIEDYLLGVELAPMYKAEKRHAELLDTPDVEDTVAALDGEGSVVIEGVNHNAIRDAEVASLEDTWPHLVTPKPVVVEHESVDELTGEVTQRKEELPIPTVIDRRPEPPVVDAALFKSTAIVNELRRSEYPPVGDQLDAIWKQLNYDRMGGKELIQDADAILGTVLAVKSKFKKVG